MEITNRATIRLAIHCFKYSLIIGTIIFLSFCIIRDERIAMFGFAYLCFAVIINLLILFTLLVAIVTDAKNRIDIAKSMGLILLNIPIALFYFWVLTEFLHF